MLNTVYEVFKNELNNMSKELNLQQNSHLDIKPVRSHLPMYASNSPLPRSYDWNLVKSFLAVFDAGSLSAASKILKISQPTLGRHIDELELSLGVILFERGRQGAVPTATAFEISDHAREIYQSVQALSLSATGSSKQLHGTVRITASQIVATYLLPTILTKLLHQAPEIEIELVATDKVENLTTREADIALRMINPQKTGLIARKVNEIALGAYAHKDYLAGRDPIEKIDDLKKHQIIGYDHDERIIDGMQQRGLNVERNFFRFRCDNQIACWQALNCAMGVGFAPKFLANQKPTLTPIVENLPLPTLPIWLVTHREVKSNHRIRMVFDFLGKELKLLELG